MRSVDEIVAEILRREGGYVDDPDDPGGATNHGITIGTMRRLGLDLTGDDRVTEADVRELSREQAAEIFKQEYYRKTGVARLPEPLQASVLDMYVNAGSNAVRILQELLIEIGVEVSVDGAIGPQTIGACEKALVMAPEHFVDAYGIARRNYYYRLGDRRPSLRKFARRRDGGKGGWIKRAEEFISARFHLSRAQHDRRVASWD